MEIGRDALWVDIERDSHRCVFFQVHRGREFDLDENRARRQWRRLENGARGMPIPQSPLRAEENLFVNDYVHRYSIPASRLELPRAHVFHRAFVQPQAERSSHLNVARPAIGAHHQRQQHATFELCKASFVAVRRLRFGNNKWRDNTRTQVERGRLSGSDETSQQPDRTSNFAGIQILL